jgi:MYXO-CTERM domain-containing protein
VQIWIYGSRADFFQALGTGAKEWTGGITLPEFSTVLIDVPPEDLEWGKGATTHELAHVIVHQQLKSPLGDLAMPHWIDEGLAVYYETIPGTLDAQFDRPLKRAIQNNTLAPIRSFSGNFPTDSSAANLAYAESYSMVDFILRHFGRDKLRALFEQFKQGRAYDDAFMQVFGVDTDGLENLWRKDIGAPERVITARPTETPGAFPTFSLSTDTTPAATTATATPEAAAVVPTSARPVATPPIGPATPSPGLCGGVFGLMGLMALGVWRRRNGHRSQ